MSNGRLRKKTVIVFFIITPIITAIIVGEIYIRLFREYTTPELLKTKSLQYHPSIFSLFVFPEKKQETESAGTRPSYYINEKGYRGKEFNKILFVGCASFEEKSGNASGNPFSPSMQAIKISLTPRCLISVRTDKQKFAPSASPIHSPSESFLPLSSTPRQVYAAFDNTLFDSSFIL